MYVMYYRYTTNHSMYCALCTLLISFIGEWCVCVLSACTHKHTTTVDGTLTSTGRIVVSRIVEHHDGDLCVSITSGLRLTAYVLTPNPSSNPRSR